MDKFGLHWKDHPQKIAKFWSENVREEDTVLVVGDISWAMKQEEVLEDLAFFSKLPGKKIYIRGNHDYWWGSLGKVNQVVGEGNVALNGTIHRVDGVTFGGVRLWDVPGLDWKPFFPKTPDDVFKEPDESDMKRLKKETSKLQDCLALLKREEGLSILLLHYPPTTPDLRSNFYTDLIENSGVEHCVFGHLHGFEFSDRESFYGAQNGVNYHLVSSDFLDFRLKKLVEI